MIVVSAALARWRLFDSDRLFGTAWLVPEVMIAAVILLVVLSKVSRHGGPVLHALQHAAAEHGIQMVAADASQRPIASAPRRVEEIVLVSTRTGAARGTGSPLASGPQARRQREAAVPLYAGRSRHRTYKGSAVLLSRSAVRGPARAQAPGAQAVVDST